MSGRSIHVFLLKLFPNEIRSVCPNILYIRLCENIVKLKGRNIIRLCLFFCNTKWPDGQLIISGAALIENQVVFAQLTHLFTGLISGFKMEHSKWLTWLQAGSVSYLFEDNFLSQTRLSQGSGVAPPESEGNEKGSARNGIKKRTYCIYILLDL